MTVMRLGWMRLILGIAAGCFCMNLLLMGAAVMIGRANPGEQFAFIGGEYLGNLYIGDVRHRLWVNFIRTPEVNVKLALAWSPGGDQIAYLRNQFGEQTIQIVNLADRRERTITAPDETRTQQAAWSPDGKRMAFSAYRHLIGDWGLYIADLMQQPAVIETVLTGLLDDPEPRWSPDGAELVYVRAVTVPNLKHLAVIDLATRQTVQISRNYGLLTPGSWSPDGSAIAFSAARSDNRIGLFIVDLATGEEQWLNNAFMPKPPNWSPRTGSLIWRGGDGDIYAREGEATRRLVAATGNDAPVWSSDGTQVLYLDDGEFTVMDADGGNRRVIAHPAYEKFNPVWRPVPKG